MIGWVIFQAGVLPAKYQSLSLKTPEVQQLLQYSSQLVVMLPSRFVMRFHHARTCLGRGVQLELGDTILSPQVGARPSWCQIFATFTMLHPLCY